MATTVVWYKETRNNLSGFLSMMGKDVDSLDVMVFVGEDKHPVRLVASKVSPEIENKRKKKLREKACKSQKNRKKNAE